MGIEYMKNKDDKQDRIDKSKIFKSDNIRKLVIDGKIYIDLGQDKLQEDADTPENLIDIAEFKRKLYNGEITIT